ncbi:FtsK/SpoIIIE family protein [Streptacidiphilus jiangxiensis]|uniref:FtsK/SpoIIIE family protein n=3 Tax=Streptacidiphilus jiangxiensis TaxID=235985 RepID=A0A1H7RRI9_STRJI|nr:FtsK/SpoIIIE family protein [Streptacidiphilus jiangxiensis]
MQIRLTVLGPRESAPTSVASSPHAAAPAADVLVSAPVGTTLGSVAAALAGAVGARPGARAGRAATHVHLYAQGRRLDERAVLGHPPLIDGAVLRLDTPDPDDAAEPAGSSAALHVVAGPDAGGIHLLHPGRVVVGRSAEADVPVDDPDVSRFHLTLEVGPEGRVTVTDSGSTNGTVLDGARVGTEPRTVVPGALIELGESALRVVPGRLGRAEVVPDGQGAVHVSTRTTGSTPRPAGWNEPGPLVGHTASGTGAAAEAAASHAHATHGRGFRVGAPPGDAQPTAEAAARRADGRSGLLKQALGRRRAAPPASAAAVPPQSPPRDPGRWPDPAELLLTALGPGPRLWERGQTHDDALVLRLGTRAHTPVTLDLRTAGSVGLTGPRPRLLGLVRGLLAQLAVLHAPSGLELVLVAADQSLPLDERTDAWSWLPWLPHLRPSHGQPCRALTAFDPTQALARLQELAPDWGLAVTPPGPGPQLSGGPVGASALTGGAGTHGASGGAGLARAGGPSGASALTGSSGGRDGGPSGASALTGAPAGSHGIPGPTGASPAAGPGARGAHAAAPRGRATVVVVDGDPGSDAARAAVAELVAHGAARDIHVLQLADYPEDLPHSCGAVVSVTGEVGTLLDMERPLPGSAPRAAGQHRAAPERELVTAIALDAVGAAWAGRLARALAPLREPDTARRGGGRTALPEAARLLDLLGLDLVTPAKISARWAELRIGSGEIATATVGVTRDGSCAFDLTDHLLVGGAPQSGRTELLRSLLAGLAVAERPDRLGLLLIEGRPPADPARGLTPAVELPHVVGHLATTDGPALREAARALSVELDRRAALLEGRSFAAWHAERALARLAPPRRPADDYPAATSGSHTVAVEAEPLPHLVVVVDDWDALVGTPLAHVLEDAALRGPRLGVRLAVTTAQPERTAGTAVDEAAQLRVALRVDSPTASAMLIHVDDAASLTEDAPGRGLLRHPDGGVTPLQTARVTGRIPRTATLRPTVTPLDWAALGEPPAARTVRELGNGPTDLALLASALQRAAESLGTAPVPDIL